MTDRTPRVSVVVPVYDPGRYIEPAIASILAQTMPAGEVEAIFVDDGSTDDTPARLDRLAADHPDRVRVIHIAPSGSPSRPRNLGIEAARGEYIQFLDADDELAPDALERVVAMADRNGSDIVVEKFASASIPRNQRLFARSVERCTLAETPALIDSSLGPAKLFRRSFLRANGITFPEGWRLMEDQRFSLQAYLRASVISIVADAPCYFFLRRDDGGHLTGEPLQVERHFANLRSIFDLVEAETTPGPLRDHILRRLLRIEVLRRVGVQDYLDLPDEERASMFGAARDLVRERIEPGVVGDLGVVNRIRLELLREDRPEDLLALARQTTGLGLAVSLQRAHWDAGVLRLEVVADLELTTAERPLVVVRDGETYRLDPALGDELLGRPLDVTEDMTHLRVGMVLKAPASALEWSTRARTEPFPPPTARSRDEGPAGIPDATPVRARASGRIDPMTMAGGADPVGPGTWDVLVRLSVLGTERTAPLGAERASGVEAACRPALLGAPPRVVVPVFDTTGLRLEVAPPPGVLLDALAGRPVRVIRDGDRLVLELAMTAGPAAGRLPVELRVRTPDGDRVLPAVLRPWSEVGVVVDAPVGDMADLPPGAHPLVLRLGDGSGAAELALGSVRGAGPARLRIEGLPRLTIAHRAAIAGRRLRDRGRSLARSLRARARRLR